MKKILNFVFLFFHEYLYHFLIYWLACKNEFSESIPFFYEIWIQNVKSKLLKNHSVLFLSWWLLLFGRHLRDDILGVFLWRSGWFRLLEEWFCLLLGWFGLVDWNIFLLVGSLFLRGLGSRSRSWRLGFLIIIDLLLRRFGSRRQTGLGILVFGHGLSLGRRNGFILVDIGGFSLQGLGGLGLLADGVLLLLFLGQSVSLLLDLSDMVAALATICHIEVAKSQQVIELLVISLPILGGHLIELLSFILINLVPLLGCKFQNLLLFKVRSLLENILSFVFDEVNERRARLSWLDNGFKELGLLWKSLITQLATVGSVEFVGIVLSHLLLPPDPILLGLLLILNLLILFKFLPLHRKNLKKLSLLLVFGFWRLSKSLGQEVRPGWPGLLGFWHLQDGSQVKSCNWCRLLLLSARLAPFGPLFARLSSCLGLGWFWHWWNWVCEF